jgi:hypothetical protein
MQSSFIENYVKTEPFVEKPAIMSTEVSEIMGEFADFNWSDMFGGDPMTKKQGRKSGFVIEEQHKSRKYKLEDIEALRRLSDEGKTIEQCAEFMTSLGYENMNYQKTVDLMQRYRIRGKRKLNKPKDYSDRQGKRGGFQNNNALFLD